MSNKPIKVQSRKGIISLFLHDVNGVKPDRVFRARPGMTIAIPADYGQSLFQIPAAERLIKRGELIIVGGSADEVVSAAQEAGDLGDVATKSIDRDAIATILKGNNVTQIKGLFKEEDRIKAQVALEIAREIVSEMNVGAIKIVEDITKSTIQVDEA